MSHDIFNQQSLFAKPQGVWMFRRLDQLRLKRKKHEQVFQLKSFKQIYAKNDHPDRGSNPGP